MLEEMIEQPEDKSPSGLIERRTQWPLDDDLKVLEKLK
jgi:hypothetical protein